MNNIATEKWKVNKKAALLGGGEEKQEKQKQLGKRCTRERIKLLTDENSFEETDLLVCSPFLKTKNYTDGVVTGFAKINNIQIAIYAQDFTQKGGSLGKHQAQKICKIMDMAAKIGCPIIGILDSGGARIDEGIHSLAGYGEIFIRNVRYSGIIPQISLVLGPCAGGAVYSPALTDFIFTTENISNLFITGPQVIEQALHQKISKEELGGASVHTTKSGVAHFKTKTEEECFEKVKKLLSYLPKNYLCEPENNQSQQNDFTNLFESDQAHFLKKGKTKLDVKNILPENSNHAYDVKEVINRIVDSNSFLEIQDSFAKNIVIGFARIENKVVGIIANQPQEQAGVLDIDASCKAARFINFCDNFSIPIITFVDVPGFMPGLEQEHNGIIRHGAKLLYAYAQATVPKITVILRKAYGGAYIVMGSKQLGADFNFAWPTAQIAVLGAKSAVTILHGRKLNEIKNEKEKVELQTKLENEYEKEFVHPFIATEYGYIDAIIEPDETRNHLIKALQITENKVEHLPKKKHGNIPL
ncbi:MAG: acyl-CoA carboxylase subunit beta [bacterium]